MKTIKLEQEQYDLIKDTIRNNMDTLKKRIEEEKMIVSSGNIPKDAGLIDFFRESLKKNREVFQTIIKQYEF